MSRDHADPLPTAPRVGLATVFLQAVLTNLLNPKAALFFSPLLLNSSTLLRGRLGVIVAASSSLWLGLIGAVVAVAGQS